MMTCDGSRSCTGVPFRQRLSISTVDERGGSFATVDLCAACKTLFKRNIIAFIDDMKRKAKP